MVLSWHGSRPARRMRVAALAVVLLAAGVITSGCAITNQYCGKDVQTDYLFACEIPVADATIYASTLTPKVGERVTFEPAAEHSHALDASLYENDWSIVAPGQAEVDTGETPNTRIFSQAGTVTVTLEVRRPESNGGGYSSREITLTVEPASSPSSQPAAAQVSQPPAAPATPTSAVFTHTPAVGKFGSNVTFDASSSTGSAPLSYEWDFEGDGTWTAPSSSPTATTTYPAPAFGSSQEFDVGLRVSGPAGTSEAHEWVKVSFDGVSSNNIFAQPIASASSSRHKRARRGGVTLRASGSFSDVGDLRSSADRLEISGLRATGSLELSGAGASATALKPFRSSRLALGIDVRTPTDEPTGSVHGLAVLRFPGAAGAACLSVNGVLDPTHAADGGLRPILGAVAVLGGSGPASRLAISGPIQFIPAKSGVLRITGTGRVSLAKRGRRMPTRCSRFARES
jgi:hypothetical protein